MGKSAVIIHAFAAYHKYLETADLQSVFLILSCQLKFGKKFCPEYLSMLPIGYMMIKSTKTKGEFK